MFIEQIGIETRSPVRGATSNISLLTELEVLGSPWSYKHLVPIGTLLKSYFPISCAKLSSVIIRLRSNRFLSNID